MKSLQLRCQRFWQHFRQRSQQPCEHHHGQHDRQRYWQRYWQRWLATVTILAVLGAVFCLYWRPDMAFDMASRLWSCI